MRLNQRARTRNRFLPPRESLPGTRANRVVAALYQRAMFRVMILAFYQSQCTGWR